MATCCTSGTADESHAQDRSGLDSETWELSPFDSTTIGRHAEDLPHPRRIAALADVAGGLVLVRARGVERYLRYFVALGAGFLMATALLEMAPESLRLSPRLGPILIMAGYCAVHLLEHTINAHFHFGEETHEGEFVSRHTGYSVLGGLERARAV